MIERNMNNFDKKVLKIIEEETKNTLCLRSKIGAVIVDEKTKKIISSGYNGNNKKLLPCSIIGCAREYFNPRAGERSEMCTGLCAEQRAIFIALNNGINLKNKTIYSNFTPCTVCSKIIVELELKRFYYLKDYKGPLSKQILKMGKVELIKLKK
jgi:dCMP deaminase